MRIRIKFEKRQPVRYLGHLDIMRFFQRVFNRAEVKMEYSGGFNPHQKMSFAQPLGVGILSEGDYLDAEIAAGQDLLQIRENMNRVCGEGFAIRSVKEVQEGAKKAMAALAYAEYHVDVHDLFSDETHPAEVCPMTRGGNKEGARLLNEDREQFLNSAIETFLARKEILVRKAAKSGTKKRGRTRAEDEPRTEIDIRPRIICLSCESGQIFMQVTAGSGNNLKPDTLLSELFRESEVEYRREKVTIVRNELYAQKWIPLEAFQTV